MSFFITFFLVLTAAQPVSPAEDKMTDSDDAYDFDTDLV